MLVKSAACLLVMGNLTTVPIVDPLLCDIIYKSALTDEVKHVEEPKKDETPPVVVEQPKGVTETLSPTPSN